MADAYYVESPMVAERNEADALLSTLSEIPSAVDGTELEWRVVRRFRGVDGMTFVVRVDGVVELEQARALAEKMTIDSELGSIYARRGRNSVLVVPVPVDPAAPGLAGAGQIAEAASPVEAVADPAVSAEPPTPASPPATLPEDGVAAVASDGAQGGAAAVAGQVGPDPVEAESIEILLAAARAHGGEEGAALIDAAAGLEFEFRRKVVEDGEHVQALHRYLRKDQAYRLEITIEAGKGRTSTTILSPKQEGWLVIQGVSVEREPERVREVVTRYSPEQVLSIPLGVSGELEGSAEWQQLRKVGEERSKDGRVAVLAPKQEAGQQRSIIEAAFYVKAGNLARIAWATDEGELVFHYRDYQEVSDTLRVPFEIRIEKDGTVIEEVEVLSFVINPALTTDLFEPPSRR